jgi:hypothetical protein
MCTPMLQKLLNTKQFIPNKFNKIKAFFKKNLGQVHGIVGKPSTNEIS